MTSKGTDCMICMDIFDINKKEGVAILSCGHAFHLHCITQLQILVSNYDLCPICRTEFITPSKDIEEIKQLKEQVLHLKLQLEVYGIKL